MAGGATSGRALPAPGPSFLGGFFLVERTSLEDQKGEGEPEKERDGDSPFAAAKPEKQQA
jgi:hypothetical protein